MAWSIAALAHGDLPFPDWGAPFAARLRAAALARQRAAAMMRAARKMARRPYRSVSAPIIYGSAAVLLTTALLVGWILVIVRTQDFGEHWADHVWLLATGI